MVEGLTERINLNLANGAEEISRRLKDKRRDADADGAEINIELKRKKK